MTITPPVSQNHPEPNITVMNRMEGKNSLVEVLYYNSLHGSEDITGAQQLYFAQQVGLRLKQVRISLNNSEVLTESGILLMHGNVRLTVYWDEWRVQPSTHPHSSLASHHRQVDEMVGCERNYFIRDIPGTCIGQCTDCNHWYSPRCLHLADATTRS